MGRVWMVAEDDPILRSILRMMLTLWEVEALVFEDGHQAWAWLDEVERGSYRLPMPEVALLDVRMPGHLGYEIGQRMRGMAATSAIPLLIMTAYHLSVQDKAMINEAAQPEHLVPKPFPSMDDFQSLIESAIAASKAKAAVIPSDPHINASVPPIISSLAEHRWNQRRQGHPLIGSPTRSLKPNELGKKPDNKTPNS